MSSNRLSRCFTRSFFLFEQFFRGHSEWNYAGCFKRKLLTRCFKLCLSNHVNICNWNNGWKFNCYRAQSIIIAKRKIEQLFFGSSLDFLYVKILVKIVVILAFVVIRLLALKVFSLRILRARRIFAPPMIKFPLSDTSAEGNRKRARVTLLQRNRGIVEFPFI